MENQRLIGCSERLLKQYGPTLTGTDLYAALGFKTYAAFHRVLSRRELGVRVFKLPGRRGWFASTLEVADWLDRQTACYPLSSASEGEQT